MFKNHPKGLIPAALANMGERFGFYTMMAILVLFLQSKFGLDGKNAGIIYSVFYALIYVLALVGGLIADKTRNYKGTIFVGLLVMAAGYLVLSIPTPTPVPNQVLFLTLSCAALFMIAFGNGLFKGNLQALVGQMYDNEKYGKMRDSGFSLFYMFINLGAMFAPLIAPALRNWWLKSNGFIYNAGLPSLCHQHLKGAITAEGADKFTELAASASGGAPVENLTEFANSYLNVFTTGFHYAFAVAIAAMLISVVIYVVNKKGFPDPADKTAKAGAANAQAAAMSAQEIRQRLWALFAVYGIVIFFWFSFHQNGLTLTFFARDYTELSLFGVSFSVEHFQSVNPFLVVFLTPVIMGLYGWLRAKNMEPSTPKKIAIGMGTAASAFILMAVVSNISNLPNHSDVVATGVSAVKVTPWLLIGTYFILTVAELFISPLGISFVSKVAPPQYQGIMQGGWLSATALGNQLLFIGAIFYESIPIWMTWSIFVTACLISMFTMLFMLKWLEKVAK